MALNFSKNTNLSNLQIPVCCFVLSGIQNKQEDTEFEAIKETYISEILQNISAEEIDNDPILQGFWDLHEEVGRAGKKNVASPENLLRLYKDKNIFPKISLVVDIYNLISMKSRLALGAHDCAFVKGNVSLKLTDGTETFLPIGYDKEKVISQGEYAYIDDNNEVICRMEVRQCEKTKVTPDTTECFYIVQGNGATDLEYVEKTAHELINTTTKYCGGELVEFFRAA